MKAIGRYDSRLQMYVEEPHDVDTSKLAFLRWLVEHGQLEHGPAGRPSGELTRLVPHQAGCGAI